MLKVPGLNAPIPDGARYGFHPGGWGKPPVDEFGRPLYGDVFGDSTIKPSHTARPEPPIDKKRWGELEEEVEDDDDEPSDDEDEEETPHASGFETPSGLSTPSGMETPESLELRKGERKKDDEDDSGKSLFQILPQQAASIGGGMMGSAMRYIIPASDAAAGVKKKKGNVDLMKSQKTDNVEVTLNPNEVENLDELNEDILKKKYEAKMSEKSLVVDSREDVSDLIAEHNKKKRKKEKDDDKKKKKYKDYKF